MSLAGVAGHGRVITKTLDLGLPAGRDEADVCLIVDVVTAIENRGPVGGLFQQCSQRWYGTVVQIGSPQPNTVEQRRKIAVARTELVESPRITIRPVVESAGGRLR